MRDDTPGLPPEELERRLRAAGRTVRGTAPADLHAFIDAVPARHPGSRRGSAPRGRRGVWLAMGAAAAAVVALVGSSVVLSLRQGQGGGPSNVAVVTATASLRSAWPAQGTPSAAASAAGPTASAMASASPQATALSPSPSPTAAPNQPRCPNATPVATGRPSAKAFAADGVSWAASPSISSAFVMAVPNGYVATTGDPSICTDVYTSPDGAVWSTPADPKIFVNLSSEQFVASFFPLVHGPTGYLFGGSAPDGSPVVWSSADGVRWSVAAPDGISYASGMLHIYPGTNGFVATDLDNWWTSADGKTWNQAAYDGWRLRRGEPGQLLLGGGEGDFSWFSIDGGKTWAQTGTPPGQKLLEGAALFGGLYYGDWEIGGQFTLFTSRDMRTWTRLTIKHPANPSSLVAFGGRLYVVDLSQDLAQEHGTLWWTSDGATWTQVVDKGGQPIAADNAQVLGGRLFVLGDGLWVGTAG